MLKLLSVCLFELNYIKQIQSWVIDLTSELNLLQLLNLDTWLGNLRDEERAFSRLLLSHFLELLNDPLPHSFVFQSLNYFVSLFISCLFELQLFG